MPYLPREWFYHKERNEWVLEIAKRHNLRFTGESIYDYPQTAINICKHLRLHTVTTNSSDRIHDERDSVVYEGKPMDAEEKDIAL